MVDIWYLYIVECSDGSLYTGITKDVDRRVHEHNFSKKGAKYTKSRRPVKLLGFLEVGESRGAALSEEATVKKLSQKDKRKLITSSPQNISIYKSKK